MRIAKYISMCSVASRRSAEQLVLEGRVRVNGIVVSHPSTIVSEDQTIEVDGKKLSVPKPRLWAYYKPVGLVVSHNDEQGRISIFDVLKRKINLPHLVSVGRLDLNSEGLILITNSGSLARHLELPQNQYSRIYLVRMYPKVSRPTDIKDMKRTLLHGITIDGIEYGPVAICLKQYDDDSDERASGRYSNSDRIYKLQRRNLWVTIEIREGKNREVRKILDYFGYMVNRLVRISYGPYKLNAMQPGDLIELDL